MDRLTELRGGEVRGDRVVYWMQASQRCGCNLALEHSVRISNASGKPLEVLFVIDPGHPSANRRSFTFMLQGIQDVADGLARRGIAFSVRQGDMVSEVLEHVKDIAALVLDRGYLRHQRRWYSEILRSTEMPVHQVEDNVVVPVSIASQKEEWSAATLRRRIAPLIEGFLSIPPEERLQLKSAGMWGEGHDWKGVDSHLESMALSGPQPSRVHKGGELEASHRLRRFIDERLHRYAENRNEPSGRWTSELSPYLHFGQVSPIMLAQEVSGRNGSEAFLEELIVRRELAVNFVHYNKDYDSYSNLPDWAKRTLDEHRDDRREYVYTLRELEHAETHDVYWNAAQSEMVATGKMHNYMRMYWGKKILEWSETPEEAYEAAIVLNDRYELDGRDPNGYAGVAWCFGKHDRPWKEREIFGKVRYMNAKGLERKFFMPAYVEMVISQLQGLEDEGDRPRA